MVSHAEPGTLDRNEVVSALGKLTVREGINMRNAAAGSLRRPLGRCVGAFLDVLWGWSGCCRRPGLCAHRCH